MKQYTFDTFIENSANQQALRICRDVAALKPIAPFPVLLVGGAGAGKTHLLYAIVDSVRNHPARPGLVCIRAREFPDQVRALIDEPGPVARIDTAVLLVDQLEQFDALVEELEALIRLFLSAGHAVVVASRVPPAELTNLTEGLRRILKESQQVSLSGPVATKPDAPGGTAPAEDPVAALRAEVEMLHSQVERDRGEAAKLAEERDAARHETESLRQRLEEAEAEVYLARSEATTASARADELQARLDDTDKADSRVAELEEALADARAKQDTESQELARLSAETQDAKAARHQAETELGELRAALEDVRAEETGAREQLETLRQERDSLGAERDKARAALDELQERFAEVAADYERCVAELDEVREQVKTASESATGSTEERDAALEEVTRLAGELNDAVEDADQAHAEARRLTDALDAAKTQAENQAEEARRAKAKLQELSALREEDRAQINKVTERAGALQVEINEAKASAAAKEDETAALREKLDETVNEREAMRGRLALLEAQLASSDAALLVAQEDAAVLREQLDAVDTEAAKAAESEIAELRARLVAMELAREENQSSTAGITGRVQSILESLALGREKLDALTAEFEYEHDGLANFIESLAPAAAVGGDVESVAIDMLQTELAKSRRTSEDLRKSIKAATDERDSSAASLAEIEELLKKQTREMEMLRHEAATQVAMANAQAGEIEGQLARLSAELQGQEQTGDIDTLTDQLISAAEMIGKLASRISHTPTPAEFPDLDLTPEFPELRKMLDDAENDAAQ